MQRSVRTTEPRHELEGAAERALERQIGRSVGGEGDVAEQFRRAIGGHGDELFALQHRKRQHIGRLVLAAPFTVERMDVGIFGK